MIGMRIRETREALALSQQQMAEKMGVSLRSQQNYEAGKREPDASYLAALTHAGADSQYILTGQRMEAASSTAGLPADEQLLLDAYRTLPIAKQKQLLADLLTGTAGKPVARKTGKDISVTGDGNRTAGRNYNENTKEK